MLLNSSRFFLTGVDTNSIAAGEIVSGEYYVKDESGVRFYFQASQVTKCTILCRSVGEAQVTKVKFVNSALADSCDDCSGDVAGIQIRIKRNPTFNHETYLDSFAFKSFTVDLSAGASATAEEVAADILEQINTLDSYTGALPYTAELDPADITNETILITSSDPEIEFDVFNIRYYPENTITSVTEAVAPTLTADHVKRLFGLGVGFIPGRDADESWQGCKNPCKMVLEGCLPAPCGSSAPGVIDTSNAVHGHAVQTPMSFELWLDQDEAGYSDFVTDLNALITPDCSDVTPS